MAPKSLDASPSRFALIMLWLSLLLTLSGSTSIRAQRVLLPESQNSASPASSSLGDAAKALKNLRFHEAETMLRVYLVRNAGSGQAHTMLAYALLRQGEPAEALAEYTRAAALRTPSAEDLRNVAQAYVLLEDLPDADKWLNVALSMSPDSADTWYNLGRLRYTQNRFAEAVDCFTKVLTLSPRSVKAANNLGLAYEGLNRQHDAEVAYREAIAWQDAGPTSDISEQPLLNLSILFLHGADPAQARPLLERAVAIAPKDPRIHEQLGQMYLHQSMFSEAARELKTATMLDPANSSLHFLLGQAYKHLGQKEEATAEFAESARLTQPSAAKKAD